MSNIITVAFAEGQIEAVAAEALEQWAYGQKLKFVGLELPANYQVDFSNWEFCGDSIPRIGDTDGVSVPTEVLTSGRNVYAFVWIQTAGAGRRLYRATIRVIPGPMPDPGTPSPEEESAIEEAIGALNAAVERTETAAGDAESAAERAEAAAASIDEGMIADAVAEYLDEHPVTVEEKDPTVPEWAKQPNKPRYTAQEVGALPSDTAIPPAVSVDSALSDSSTNPVQNKVVKAALDGKMPKGGGTMGGAIAMDSHKITGLANGTADGDAVNLGQVSGLISTNTAFYRGSFASKAALLAAAWQTADPGAAYYVTNNDYAVVQDDESQNDECWRYVYVSGTGWTAQYRINESPLTTVQLAALNSGATAANIASISEKFAANQGAGNAGKWLKVDTDGSVITADLPVYSGGVS